MKKKFTDIITQAGKEYSLSADQKARMTRVIKEYTALKPLPQTEVYSVSVSYSLFSFAYRPMAAALVLVLIFGSGVSYAAEGALPGDALYSVKTYVNEPARLALATNAEAKAEVQIEFAERRIEEALVLASEGRLDDDTQEELAVAFEAHATAAASNIAEVETTEPAPELAARFENRLVAHENVLAEVEVDLEEETEHSHRLSDAIRATSMVLAEARYSRDAVALNVAVDIAAPAAGGAEIATMQAEPMMMTLAIDAPADNSRSAKSAESTAPSAPSPDAKTIARMKVAAERSIKSAEKTLRSGKSLSVDGRARAEAEIELAKSFINDGEAYLKNDQDADAYASFQESLRVSEQASVYIKAAPSLEKARERVRNIRANATNTNAHVDAQTTITAPMPSIEATVTLPVVPLNIERKQDDTEESDEPAHEDTPKKSGLFNNLKIDLSL